MAYVLDASAMVAYLRQEHGAERVVAALECEGACLAHSLNLCEVFYDFHRSSGYERAVQAMEALRAAGVAECPDMSKALWHGAATLKSVYRRISLADCFAVALAQQFNATLLTSDHHELDAIAAANECQILFIR